MKQFNNEAMNIKGNKQIMNNTNNNNRTSMPLD